MISQPLIGVRDVEASSIWYQQLFNCKSGHVGREYERLTIGNVFFLQLHAWNIHDHPNLDKQDRTPNGHWVLLWFQVDDFDQTMTRLNKLNATIIDGPKINQNANQSECWIYDLDNYVVVIASKTGEI